MFYESRVARFVWYPFRLVQFSIYDMRLSKNREFVEHDWDTFAGELTSTILLRTYQITTCFHLKKQQQKTQD